MAKTTQSVNRSKSAVDNDADVERRIDHVLCDQSITLEEARRKVRRIVRDIPCNDTQAG